MATPAKDNKNNPTPFKIILESVESRSDLSIIAQKISDVFSIAPEAFQNIANSAPIILVEGLSKRVVKNIRPSLLEISKDGVNFRITARPSHNIPALVWPSGAKTFTSENGELVNVFNINWKATAIRCPHCSLPIMFKPFEIHPVDQSHQKSTAPVKENSSKADLKKGIMQNEKKILKKEQEILSELMGDDLDKTGEVKDKDGELIEMDNDIMVDLSNAPKAGTDPYLIKEKDDNPFEETSPNDTKFEEDSEVLVIDEDEDLDEVTEPLVLDEADDEVIEAELVSEDNEEGDEDVDEDNEDPKENDFEDEDEKEDIDEEEEPKPKKKFTRKGLKSTKYKKPKSSKFSKSKKKNKGKEDLEDEEDVKPKSKFAKKIGKSPKLGKKVGKSTKRSRTKTSKFSKKEASSNDNNLYDVVLGPIKKKKIQEKTADLIADITGIPIEDADELVLRKSIPAVTEVSKKEAKSYLKEFEALKVKGKVRPHK